MHPFFLVAVVGGEGGGARGGTEGVVAGAGELALLLLRQPSPRSFDRLQTSWTRT